MEPLRTHRGKVVPLDRANIDTDQIIPKQFLKRIERTGYGDFLFYDWRYDNAGKPKDDFVLNQKRYEGGSILLAGRNFGCGSSREHAAWALDQYGFKVIIAASYADIFYSNAGKNGLLTVVLDEAKIQELLRRAERSPNYKLTVDLKKQTISDDSGEVAEFEIDAFRKKCLMEGYDEIGLTLEHEKEITAFETKISQLSAVSSQ